MDGHMTKEEGTEYSYVLYLKNLLLSFIGSLTLCDHMGDVSNDVDFILKELGYDVEWDDLNELSDWCGEQGIETLYGTSLKKEED